MRRAGRRPLGQAANVNFRLVSRSDSPPDDGEALDLGVRARMPGLSSLVSRRTAYVGLAVVISAPVALTSFLSDGRHSICGLRTFRAATPNWLRTVTASGWNGGSLIE